MRARDRDPRSIRTWVVLVTSMALVAGACTSGDDPEEPQEAAPASASPSAEPSFAETLSKPGDAFVPLEGFDYVEAPVALEKVTRRSIKRFEALDKAVDGFELRTVVKDGEPAALVTSLAIDSTYEDLPELREALFAFLTGSTQEPEHFTVDRRDLYFTQDNSGLRSILFQMGLLYVFTFGENGPDVRGVAEGLLERKDPEPAGDPAPAAPATTIEADEAFVEIPGYGYAEVPPNLVKKSARKLQKNKVARDIIVDHDIRTLMRGSTPVGVVSATVLHPGLASFPSLRRDFMTGTGRFRTIPLGGATGYVFEDLEDGLVAVGFWYRDAIGVSVAAPDLATARDAAEQMVHAGEFGEPIPL